MKLKFYLMMLVAAVCMTACSSDDDPANPVLDIVGTYNGYSTADFQYTTIPMTMDGEKFSLTANEDGTATITFASIDWGTFTITNATVTYKNDAYTIAGSGKAVIAMGAAPAKEYDCTVAGTISKDKKSVSLLFNAPVPMGGLDVTFTSGDAPASMIIAAVYNGSLDVFVMSHSTETGKVTIKSQENEKAEVTLAGFGSGNMTLEDVVITDVEVTAGTDGTYTLAGTINTQSGPYKVTGTVAGTIKDGEANIVFTMKPGDMPMNIVATFTTNQAG